MAKSSDPPKKGTTPANSVDTDPMFRPEQTGEPRRDVSITIEDVLPPEAASEAAPPSPRPKGPARSGTARPKTRAGTAEPRPSTDVWSHVENDDRWLEISHSSIGPLPDESSVARSSPPPQTSSTHAAGRPAPALPRESQTGTGLRAPPRAPEAAHGEADPGSAVADDAAPAWACLLRLNGAAIGARVALRRAEVRVGRSSLNDLVLGDASVSRQHARLLLLPDGTFKVVDLKSGNGTFVGGRRVTEKVLQLGDELAFGSESFRLVGLDGAIPTPPVAAPPSRLKLFAKAYALPALLALLLSVAGVAAAVGLRLYQWHRQTDMRQAAFTRFLSGIEQLSARAWPAAEASFVASLAADPQNWRARNYLKALERERVAQRQLTEARGAQERADWGRAYETASSILDSTFRSDAQQIMRSIDNDLETRVARAQAASDANQPLQAGQLLALVERIHPGRPDVAAMLVRASLKQPLLHVAPSSLVSRAEARRKQGLSGRAAEAQRTFVGGDINGAIDMLEGLNSEDGASLRARLQKFKAAYERGDAEHQVKRAALALAALADAKALETSIAQGTSHYAGEIARKMADMYFIEGQQSVRDNQLAGAYERFHNGLLSDPTHALCRNALTELNKRAQTLLDEAQRSSERSAARQKLQLVMDIVPPSSDAYRTAKARLDTL